MDEEEEKMRMKIVVNLEITERDLNKRHIFSDDLTITGLKIELIEAMAHKMNEMNENLGDYIQSEKDLDETPNEKRKRIKEGEILLFFERIIIKTIKEFNGELIFPDLLKILRERKRIDANIEELRETLGMLQEPDIIKFKDGKYFVDEDFY